MNKKVIMFFSIFVFIILCCSITNAGYIENNSENEKKILTSVVYLNNFESEKTNLTATNTRNDNQLFVVDQNLLQTDNVDNLKNLLSNGSPVLVKYTDRITLKDTYKNINIDFSNISDDIIVNNEEITEYNQDGYMNLELGNDGKIISGGFYTTANTDENLLRNYNMYKGNLELNAKEETEQVIQIEPKAYTTGNYKLRFYWSDSTEDNKVYTTYDREGYILNNLYRGEALQDKESLSVHIIEPEWGGVMRDEYHRVQVLDVNGNFTEGFYPGVRIYTPPPGDEGWVTQDVFYSNCIFLYQLIKDAYDTDYRGARTNGYVARAGAYYGIRIKGLTTVYDTNGTLIGALHAGDYVWTITSATKCGINPARMTVKAYSDSINGTINRYPQDTFINAQLDQVNPINYKITTRWW